MGIGIRRLCQHIDTTPVTLPGRAWGILPSDCCRLIGTALLFSKNRIVNFILHLQNPFSLGLLQSFLIRTLILHLWNESDILTGCVEANKKGLIRVMCQRELAEELTKKNTQVWLNPWREYSMYLKLEKHTSNYLKRLVPSILFSYFDTVNSLV